MLQSRVSRSSALFVIVFVLAALLGSLPVRPAHAQATCGSGQLCRSSSLASRPFRGSIELDVDATDTRHGIIKTHEVIPVQGDGDLILFYPQWETASHAPTVPVASLTGLIVSVDGKRVEWRRDPFDVYAFHIPVRHGARTITADFQYLADHRSMREDMITVPWQRVLLYPSGWSSAAIPITAGLRLPGGLTPFTSLDRANADTAVLRFATTPLDRLVDAPVLAARHARTILLSNGSQPSISLDVLSDDPAVLAVGEDETRRMRDLVRQTTLVFGPAPFRHYDAIIAPDDAMGADLAQVAGARD